MKQTFQQRVANANRVREIYQTDPHARELSAERGRRYRERQAALAHEAALARWVAAVIHAEGRDPAPHRHVDDGSGHCRICGQET